uniref:Uncharacterized protein n=1 Tax=Glossina palpalis gambiensis TaxID=67801 RepID=A0A1B0BCW0_9MUSC
MVGLLPANYVEIIIRGEMQYLKQQTRQKPSEGHARAKYNFQAQSDIDLSLVLIDTGTEDVVTRTDRTTHRWTHTVPILIKNSTHLSALAITLKLVPRIIF